jgi:type I restriction enzyme M protein
VTKTSDIVQKLWGLCHVLRDDGITYHQYVTELTLLLFLKMAKETDKEVVRDRAGNITGIRIPEGLRWDDLKSKNGVEALDFYKRMLLDLGGAKREESGKNVPRVTHPMVVAIYAGASTSLREPKHLHRLVSDIDGLDWFSAKQDGLGDLYEGLLEKNATETKSGAGQYFTPRPLIEAIVDVVKPQAEETIQDPAAGTAGFLVAADTYIKRNTDDLFKLPTKTQEFQKKNAFIGVELVPETRRLALMNCLLHDIEGVSDGAVQLGDTLSGSGAKMAKVDVILTNPPFGTKRGGGKPTRDDFTFPTSNKQLAFIEHIYRGLKPGGRAAVVIPDNVLFEEGVGRDIRADLMDKCNLHTILRLPTGIFYAQGVKTNVLFFTRGTTDKGNTKAVWFYDLRANAPSFGKRTPFTRAYLQPFVDAYGDDPHGGGKRKDEGEEGHFRRFTREEIAKSNDNLNVSWLKDENATQASDLEEPEVIAARIRVELAAAMEDIDELTTILAGEEAEAS